MVVRLVTAAVVGLTAGVRMLSSSFYYSDLTEKFSYATDQQHHAYSIKSVTVSKKTASFNSRRPAGSYPKALKQCTHGPTDSNSEPRVQRADDKCWEVETTSVEVEVEALLLLQKSMLEKQLELSFEHTGVTDKLEKESHVVSSGIPARVRRITSKTRTHSRNSEKPNDDKRPLATVTPELLQNRQIGRVRGFTCYELLTHAQVVKLSRKIRVGLSLDDQRSRLKEKLGYDPSDDELAVSLRMDRTKLRSKLLECNLAREKLAMSNVRLVISIAQKYENMGADMADLVQGGLIGLLRGIEKFDSSKGFKISTYVYWWIRQGVCKALMENSRTLRLPTHLHERLSLIRGAKSKLKDKGINPSTATIAETLNMSRKKVENATEAVRTVSSLDSEPFPSFNGFPGKTYHSYIADNHPENIPWHCVDEWALKNEVSELIDTTLRERERAIIRLYHGLDEKSLTWEEISKRIGLSRERVRQVGLVAVEKLKYAARKRRMEALLLKH